MKKMLMSVMAAIVMVGCNQKAPPAPQPDSENNSAVSDVLADIVGVTVAVSDSMAIPAIKKSAIPGKAITIEGKVMGTMHPFVDNRAVMIIGDEASITSCEVMDDDDHCKTPWDVCCEESENIQAGSATIQVVGDDGRPLRAGLKGVGGLKELSKVRVSGLVAKGSSPELLIVNAKAIEVL